MLAPKVFSLCEERLDPEKAGERISLIQRDGNKTLRPELLLNKKVPEVAVKQLANRVNYLKVDEHGTKLRVKQARGIAAKNQNATKTKATCFKDIEGYIERTRQDLKTIRSKQEEDRDNHRNSLIKAHTDLINSKREAVQARKTLKKSQFREMELGATAYYDQQNTLINLEKDEAAIQMNATHSLVHMTKSMSAIQTRKETKDNEAATREFKTEELERLVRNREACQLLEGEAHERKKNYQANKHEVNRGSYDKWYREEWANKPVLEMQTKEVMEAVQRDWAEHRELLERMRTAQEDHQSAIRSLEKSMVG